MTDLSNYGAAVISASKKHFMVDQRNSPLSKPINLFNLHLGVEFRSWFDFSQSIDWLQVLATVILKSETRRETHWEKEKEKNISSLSGGAFKVKV